LGVLKALENLPSEAWVLDLGCGNGELALEWLSRDPTGRYIGVDSSPLLLEIARGKVQDSRVLFHVLDLADPAWPDVLEMELATPLREHIDRVLSFSVLHHLPDAALRKRIALQVHRVLNESGQWIHSNWNFLASKRYQARILPWETIDLTDEDVEEGDYLLDWRRMACAMSTTLRPPSWRPSPERRVSPSLIPTIPMAKAAGSGSTNSGEKNRRNIVECGRRVSGRRQSLVTPEHSSFWHLISLFLTLNNLFL